MPIYNPRMGRDLAAAPHAKQPAVPAAAGEERISERKKRIRELADRLAPERESWIRRNTYYYEQDYRYMRFLVPAGLRVLDLGCGTGRLLAELNPVHGVGVDMSRRMIEFAKQEHPHLDFRVGDAEDA